MSFLGRYQIWIGSLFIGIGVLSSSAFAGSRQGTVTGQVLFEDRMPVACVTAPCDPQPSIFPLPGIKVTAHRRGASAAVASTITDPRGSYRLALDPGRYTIRGADTSMEVRVRRCQKSRANLLLVVY